MAANEANWREAEAQEEAQHSRDISDRIRDLAVAIARYPHSWAWGDGCGGAIIRELEQQLAIRGFSRTDDGYPERGPKRKAMTATRSLAVFKRDRYRCVVCGSQEELTVDHVVPVASGGDNELENLQTLCRKCNTSKGVKSMDEWKPR